MRQSSSCAKEESGRPLKGPTFRRASNVRRTNKFSSMEDWEKWEKEVFEMLSEHLQEPNLAEIIMLSWSSSQDVILEFHQSLRVYFYDSYWFAGFGSVVKSPGVPSNFQLPFDAPKWRTWKNLMEDINYTTKGFMQEDTAFGDPGAGELGWTEVGSVKKKVGAINSMHKEWCSGGAIVLPNQQSYTDTTLHSTYKDFRAIMDKYDTLGGCEKLVEDISDEDYGLIKFLVIDVEGEGMINVWLAEDN